MQRPINVQPATQAVQSTSTTLMYSQCAAPPHRTTPPSPCIPGTLHPLNIIWLHTSVSPLYYNSAPPVFSKLLSYLLLPLRFTLHPLLPLRFTLHPSSPSYLPPLTIHHSQLIIDALSSFLQQDSKTQPDSNYRAGLRCALRPPHLLSGRAGVGCAGQSGWLLLALQSVGREVCAAAYIPRSSESMVKQVTAS